MMIYQITEDKKAILKAQELLYKELFEPLGFPSNTQEKLSILGKEYYFVSLKDNEIIGVMVLVVDEKKVELHHAVIIKEYRNQGIGKKLWKEIYEFSKKEKIQKIELYSRNTAINFWESVGFIEVSDEWYEMEMFIKHNIRHKKMEIQIQ
jgi:ribosomal protein S18 acetylase RimI-like enzyme